MSTDTTPRPRGWWTTRQVCAHLQVSRTTLGHRVAAAELAGVRTPRRDIGSGARATWRWQAWLIDGWWEKVSAVRRPAASSSRHGTGTEVRQRNPRRGSLPQGSGSSLVELAHKLSA